MQPSFLSLAQQKKLKCERFLEEMEQVIPWEQFLGKVYRHYEEKDLGRNKTDAKLLLKIYFLQQWYNLSDPGMEEAIYDRNSFQKFLGIDLLAARVPDESTILHFRHFLEKHKLQEEFFAIVERMMEEKGYILRKGTCVDATILIAPSSTKNRSKKRDPEMTSTKKGNTWYFGMKAHIGTDTDSGLVHSLKTTTAKVHDSEMFTAVQHGQEKALFGDKAQASDERKRDARKKGIFWGVTDKARRGRKLSSKQHRRNNKLSSVRAFVEHPFRVLKCQWNYRKVRYRGLLKNSLQLHTLFTLFNLYKVRTKLLST